MTSSMHGIPEPIHLYAQHVEGPPGQADGVVRVVNGEGTIVAQATPADFVKVTIEALKMMGVDHETSVIIQGVSGNPAFNGALKHHGA
jgi:hypothetical protein